MSGLPPIPKDLKKLRPYFTLARQIAKAGRAPSTICSWLLRRHAVLTGARMPGGQTPDGRAFILAALQMVETEKDALPPHSGEEELEILQEYAFKNFKLAETPDFAGQANKATAIIYLNAAKMFECLVSTAGEDSQHIPVAQFVMLKNACMSRSQEIVRALKEGRRPDPPTYAPTDSGGGGAAAAPTFGGGGGGGGGAAAAPQFGGGGGAAAPQFGGGGGGGSGAAAPVFGGGGGAAAAGQQPSFSPAPAPQWQSPSSGGSGGGGGGGYVPTFGGGGGGGAAPPPAPAPAPDYETDDIDFFDSLIPAAPTSKPGSGGGNRPSSGGAGGPGGSPPAKPVFRSAPSPSNPPPARQQQQAPSNQPAQHAGGGAVGAAMAAVAKAKASDAARNYGDALEEYKNALSQLLTVNKTPGLAPEQKTQLMGEARHGLTRAEAIKVELTTLPPALPANSLDPLFSVQLPDPSTVRLVSEALNQDLRGNLGNALEVYKRALSSLMGGMKAVAANPQAKAVVVGQLKAYMARAEQLKDWLRARGRSTD